MAIAFTPEPGIPGRIQNLGSMMALVGTLTFSGSYSTGGDAVDLTEQFKRNGMGKVFAILGNFRGYGLEYDPVNKKIKLYSSANTELAAGAYNAALTGSPVPVVVVGR